MEFASLIPLLVRRWVLPIACISLNASSSFGQSGFFAVSSTPYDHQMMRVYPVIASTTMQWPGPISSLAVTNWMIELRGMPYQYRRYWQTPAEVESAQASDCKGKAVALYARMRSCGMRNIRVVIGKRHLYDSPTHAWVEWQTTQGKYVLDPTFNEMPTPAAEISPLTYVPLYAYDGEHKYRATNARFVVPPTRVATGTYANRVYTPVNAGSTFAQPTFSGFGSEPSSLAASRYATVSTQSSRPAYQYSQSNVQRSSTAVQGIRQPVTVATTRNASVRYTNAPPLKPVTTHELPTSNVRSPISPTAKAYQIRTSVVSQNGNQYVIRRQLSPATKRQSLQPHW
jgi:hypothetical protein